MELVVSFSGLKDKNRNLKSEPAPSLAADQTRREIAEQVGISLPERGRGPGQEAPGESCPSGLETGCCSGHFYRVKDARAF